MKFSSVVFSLALTSVSASLRTESEAGQSLISKARKLDDGNNYYYSWIKDYSIKFTGCAAIPQFEREGQDGAGGSVTSNLLAKFKLCPSDKCGRCPNAGEYVVDMREFVESYQQAKEAANEATCEAAEYSCEYKCQNGEYVYNGNDDANANNDEYCTYQCLVDQGLGYCAQEDDDNNQNNVDMDQFGECRAMNQDGNNNNNGNNNGNYNGNSQIYYTGARCTSKGVFAAVFTDAACTVLAPSGTYEKLNYGYALPTEPMVEPDCISCLDSSNDNNDNGYGISETCEDLYEQSAKCEKKVKGTQYQDNSSCELIHTTIPKLSKALQGGLTGGNVATVFAWIFGIAVAFMGWYIYRLHKILGKSAEPGSFSLMGTSA